MTTTTEHKQELMAATRAKQLRAALKTCGNEARMRIIWAELRALNSI